MRWGSTLQRKTCPPIVILSILSLNHRRACPKEYHQRNTTKVRNTTSIPRPSKVHLSLLTVLCALVSMLRLFLPSFANWGFSKWIIRQKIRVSSVSPYVLNGPDQSYLYTTLRFFMAVIRVSTNSEFANSNVIIPQDKYFCGYVCSDL